MKNNNKKVKSPYINDITQKPNMVVSPTVVMLFTYPLNKIDLLQGIEILKYQIDMLWLQK